MSVVDLLIAKTEQHLVSQGLKVMRQPYNVVKSQGYPNLMVCTKGKAVALFCEPPGQGISVKRGRWIDALNESAVEAHIVRSVDDVTELFGSITRKMERRERKRRAGGKG